MTDQTGRLCVCSFTTDQTGRLCVCV